LQHEQVGQGPLPGDVLARLVSAHRRLADVDPDDLEGALQALAEEAVRLFGERSIVSLLDGEELVCRAVAGRPGSAKPGDRLSVRGTLAGLAVRTGEPQLCLDSLTDDRVDPERNRRVGVRSSVVVPLVHAGSVLGNLSVLSSRPHQFGAGHRDVLTLLASAGAQAVAVAVERQDGRTTRQALADSRRMLGAARHVSGAGVWQWDVPTGRLTWSDEMFRLAGFAPGEMQPTIEMWTAMFHPEDVERCLLAREQARTTGEGYQQHFRIIAADGVLRHVHSWAQVEQDHEGSPLRVIGATIDVTELARLTRTDPLTGLFNRAVLDERLAEALAASGPDHHVALLLCDLDRFKLVNDSLGHQVGDALLADVAGRLMTSCPGGSLVARLGGDEFAVLLPRLASPGEAAEVAERVVQACRTPFDLNGGSHSVVCTATVGIAVAGSPDHDPGELFREADLALYQAKEAGRNTVALFDDTMRAAVEARVRTEDVLRSALDAERLAVVYQPLVCLRTGAVVGVEALGRVIDAELGPLSPAVFIRVAEETGLVVPFDHWVLERAARLAARWRSRTPSGEPQFAPHVAVNFSARTLEQPDVAAVVAGALERCSAPGSRLHVEITEHSLLDRGTAVRRELRELRRLGVSVGMDDFGTGWSAMAYLTGLQLQFMKIDRSFVVRIAEGDDRADAVVQAIVDLGHAHGLTVVAEGVETERQAQRLRDMGCDQAQGWWFARPVPEEQLDATVTTWNARALALPWSRWGHSRNPDPASA
jgi:diguanylate cyclase (GGDEF)-like protein